MPDLTPSLEILRKLGLSMPQIGAAPSNEQVDLNDLLARASQQNDPNWKKAARIGIGSLVGGTKGLLGIDPSEDVKKRIISGNATPDEKAEWYSSGATQMGQGIADAGLPFAAYGNKVFHGSTTAFDKFNAAKNDKSDVLGWLTHFAEDPEYADMYATGGMKNYKNDAKPNIRAATPQAQNVLDLVNPNMDDLSQTVAAIKDDWSRRAAIQSFKEARRNPRVIRNNLKSTHYPNPSEIPLDEIPAIHLAEQIRLKPGELENSPFDAIRYNDMNYKAFAVPEHTPITTPWGTLLNDTPKPLTVTRLPDDYQGTSELAVNPKSFTPHPSKATSYQKAIDAIDGPDYFGTPKPKGPSDLPFVNAAIKNATKKSGWTITSPHTGEHALEDFTTYGYGKLGPNEMQEQIKNFPSLWEGYTLNPPKSQNSSSTEMFKPTDDYVKSFMGKKLTIGKGPNAFNVTINNPTDLEYLTDHINEGASINEIQPPKGNSKSQELTSDNYTIAQQNAILDEAEKLGFDYHHSNLSYPELEAKIKELKGNQSDVHDLGNAEDYEETVDHPNFGPITKQDAQHFLNAGEISHSWYDNAFGTFAQKPWDSKVK